MGTAEQQYGRPIAYYQQLQALNLQAAWAEVKVPVLALHGEFDWIMSRGDIETIAALVNQNVPGKAEFVELPAAGPPSSITIRRQRPSPAGRCPSMSESLSASVVGLENR